MILIYLIKHLDRMLVKSKGRLLAVTQLQLPIPNELVEAQQDVNAFDGRRRSNIYIRKFVPDEMGYS